MADSFATYTIHTSDRHGDCRCFIYRTFHVGGMSHQLLIASACCLTLEGAVKLAVTHTREWIKVDRQLGKV